VFGEYDKWNKCNKNNAETKKSKTIFLKERRAVAFFNLWRHCVVHIAKVPEIRAVVNGTLWYNVIMQHPPKSLQATLWSVHVDNLDIEKDKVYIIHQILSYGSIEEWKWLLRTYREKGVLDVFTNFSYKDYRDARFLFVKNFLLGIHDGTVVEKNYVKDIS